MSYNFSGFANEKQENYYCNVIEKLIKTLSERVLNFYLDEPIDEIHFERRILKLSHLLEECEKFKNLKPEFSLLFQDLTAFLKKEYKRSKSRESLQPKTKSRDDLHEFTNIDLNKTQ